MQTRCFFMELKFKAKIMDEAAIDRTLIRIAHQILEKNEGTERLCLLGIRTRGVPLAQRLAANIRRIDGVDVPVGELDITLYRDDLSPVSGDPVVSKTDIPFSVQGKTVFLVDDVIYTCRTARAALDAVMFDGFSAEEIGRFDAALLRIQNNLDAYAERDKGRKEETL